MKKIAVLGFGCIGSGVCKLLTDENSGFSGRLKYICDLRDIPGRPYKEMHIKDFDIILSDPEVAVVAELTGARRAAFELSKKAMEAGKSVVTSNKEVVSAFGPELLRIAAENNVSYLFEAAVGGAIPIIRPLRMNLASDRITKIYGILNGTTNYILTRMNDNGIPYGDALREAKELGYAEPDPTSDVCGLDTCRKISVLSAFIDGGLIPPEKIPTVGIEDIDTRILRLAEMLGGRIKLIGSAEKTGDGVSASVAPCFVSRENMLYSVSGVNNGILVRCEASGDLMFFGRGAGAIPTGEAVLSDIAEALSGICLPLEWHLTENGPKTYGQTFEVSDRPFDKTERAAEYGGLYARITDGGTRSGSVYTAEVI